MAIEQDIDQLNDDIAGWDQRNKKDLISELNALNVKHVKRSPNKTALQKALRSRITQRNGLTDKIAYIMPRSAIFLAKGVSKGHPITNPRTAKNWYNPVIDKNIDGLAEIIANGGGNLIINNLNIK